MCNPFCPIFRDDLQRWYYLGRRAQRKTEDGFPSAWKRGSRIWEDDDGLRLGLVCVVEVTLNRIMNFRFSPSCSPVSSPPMSCLSWNIWKICCPSSSVHIAPRIDEIITNLFSKILRFSSFPTSTSSYRTLSDLCRQALSITLLATVLMCLSSVAR